jgi:hypothetical protein
MTERRPDRKPVQMSLFEQRTVPVSWVAKRWDVSNETVLRRLQSGDLDGYRITVLGWWRIFEQSVFEYEAKMRLKFREPSTSGGAR